MNRHRRQQRRPRQQEQQNTDSSRSAVTTNVDATNPTVAAAAAVAAVPKWQKQKSFICPLLLCGGSGSGGGGRFESTTTNLYSRKRHDETSTYEKLSWYLSHSKDHQLEELIFRGGGSSSSSSSRISGRLSSSTLGRRRNLFLLDSSRSSSSTTTTTAIINDSISLPVIMLSRIQELIHTRKYWKKIELSGRGDGGDTFSSSSSKSSRSAAYILETLHSRHVLVPTGGINNYRGGRERRLAKAINKAASSSSSSSSSTKAGKCTTATQATASTSAVSFSTGAATTATSTMVIDKLVLEYATPTMIQELRKVLRYTYTVKIKCLVFRYTSFKLPDPISITQRINSNNNNNNINNFNESLLTKNLILSVLGYHHQHYQQNGINKFRNDNRKLTSFQSSSSNPSPVSSDMGPCCTATVESLIITGSTFEEENSTSSHQIAAAAESTIRSSIHPAMFLPTNDDDTQSVTTINDDDSLTPKHQGKGGQQSTIQEVVDALIFCRDHHHHRHYHDDDDDNSNDDDDGDKNDDSRRSSNKEDTTTITASSSFSTKRRNHHCDPQQQQHKLRELCISDCHLEDTEIEEIVEALIPVIGKQRHGLRTYHNLSPSVMLDSLDLSNNYCQADGIKAISKLIGFGFLRHLNLSNQDCWDDRSYMMPLWDAILRGHNGVDGPFSSLETLDLSDNFLHDGNMKELFQHECVLSPSSSLSSSNVRRTSNCLRKLILRGNNFTDDLLLVLAESLPYMMVQFPNLRWIDLRRNQKMTSGRDSSINALTQSLDKLGSCMVNSIVPTSSPFRSLSSSFLWYLFLDEPTPELLLQLALYRAGIWRGRRGILVKQDDENDDYEDLTINGKDTNLKNMKQQTIEADVPALERIPHKFWPMILERCTRCVPSSKADNEVDSLMNMNNISSADCIYRLLPHFVGTMADDCTLVNDQRKEGPL